MKLNPTAVSHTYEVKGKDGYRFTVASQYDPEWGWSASVVMTSSGIISAEESVIHLRHAAESFLRQLDALEKDEP